jgi:small subunit ribosomal protein S15
MLTKERKAELTAKYGKNEKDSGNVKVQVAILTEEINYLNDHFKTHKKDNHSKVGLMKKVGKRKSLTRYLHDNDFEGYKALIQELGLRK